VHAEDRRGGPLLATAAYVAPELVAGRPATPASDVYSTAILLYELLTGEVPFDGPDPAKVAQRHLQEEVPSPRLTAQDVPEGLAQLVVLAASREPEARPVDAGAFARRRQAGGDRRRTAAASGAGRADHDGRAAGADRAVVEGPAHAHRHHRHAGGGGVGRVVDRRGPLHLGAVPAGPGRLLGGRLRRGAGLRGRVH